jgi:hypothetical protein
MRTATLVVGLLFTSVAVAFAVWLGQPDDSPRVNQKMIVTDDESWPKPSPTGPHPKAVCDEPLHEFDKALVGEERSHTFVIRNEGEAELVLVKGPTTCKCTFSEMAQNSIPPGESAEVTLSWKAEAPAPMFSQSADIRTNDPENLTLRLEIRGTVDELVRIEPSGIWMAGEVSGTEPSVVSGVIASSFLEEFQVHELVPSSEGIQAEAVPVSEGELAVHGGVSGYRINIMLSPQGPIGHFQEEVTLRTDIRDGTDFTIQVAGHRPGPVRVVPMPPTRWFEDEMLVGLGRIPASEGVTGKLAMFVDLPEGLELQMDVAKSTPEFLKVTLERDAGFGAKTRARYNLTIEIPPGLPPTVRSGDNAGTITFTSNHPAAPEFTLKAGFVTFQGL